MENNNQKKEILIRKDKIISYDSQNCYVNDNIQTSTEPEQPFMPEEMANKEKISFYNSFFRKHFQHVVVLSAAGTSRDNGKDKKKCGKTRDELWEYCQREIDILENDINSLKSRNFYLNKDIENLLSYVILYSKINDSNETFQNKISTIENKIAEACRLELQIDSPHKLFLDKITARKPSDSRIQLFTTNYDTLFEQAAQAGGFVIIDGFSFTQPRVFSGRYFDYDIVNRERTRLKQEDSFVSKVFHLYKLHGSLNWVKNNYKIRQEDNPDRPLIIYPASSKYESSYEQPYFEMMSRFQQALRKENVLLIVIGFGFQDKHIQNVILEAVNQNPSFQLVIVNYNSDGGIKIDELKDFFGDSNNPKSIKRNVTIIFDSFKDFTNNYPENKTYSEDEPIQS
jgi:hypothetical protein